MRPRLTDFRELTAREITGFDCNTNKNDYNNGDGDDNNNNNLITNLEFYISFFCCGNLNVLGLLSQLSHFTIIFSPSGEHPEQHKLAHTLYNNQLTVAEQYFTNIAAIQNMRVL